MYSKSSKFASDSELAIFAKEGPINSAMLWSVGEDLKPHAMAFSMLLAHLFGDIPSPPILGFLLDTTTDYTGTYLCNPGMQPNPVRISTRVAGSCVRVGRLQSFVRI